MRSDVHERPAFERAAGVRRFGQLLLGGTVVLVVIVFVVIYAMQVNAIKRSLRSQAESYIELVQHAREWNAMHGGVWVQKELGAESNEYLRQLGMDPDLRTADGRTLTLRNPAMMTREIAELTDMDSSTVFRIVSLEPCNPTRDPDCWEREVLNRYRAGKSPPEPVTGIAPLHGEDYYRYMVPLRVEKACLKCHEDYDPGDVRGGLSVAIRYEPVREAMRQSAMVLSGLMVLTLGFVTTSMTMLFRQFRDRLAEASAELETMAVTDDLTGLPNRRAVLERLEAEVSRARRTHSPLCVVMIDLDHFKQVNDRCGHAVGDQVLKATAERLRGLERDYDVVARYGGEEFLIIAPETDLEGALALAERARAQLHGSPVTCPSGALDITLSAGVAQLRVEESADALLGRADQALYLAKRDGRDRVVSAD